MPTSADFHGALLDALFRAHTRIASPPVPAVGTTRMSVSQPKVYICAEQNNHVVPIAASNSLYIECRVDVSFFVVQGAQKVLELNIHITISYTPCNAINASIETTTMPEAIVFVGKYYDKLILLAEKVAPPLRILPRGP
ncbi:hypothetical protein DL767_001528 [Monosporascus sp. MG133]|nr:hypothetical protein DL767_001528 [Monosporascus sp. MG133]